MEAEWHKKVVNFGAYTSLEESQARTGTLQFLLLSSLSVISHGLTPQLPAGPRKALGLVTSINGAPFRSGGG